MPDLPLNKTTKPSAGSRHVTVLIMWRIKEKNCYFDKHDDIISTVSVCGLTVTFLEMYIEVLKEGEFMSIVISCLCENV